ncbi:hypothetical protein ANO11243_000790 [Dothideomycetidae sp. 11243]|nr:hypothetical protein ANO11243_000790 [fungal sp. No.11243]
MSSQVLAGELAAISQEAKRKYPEIRTAADKSLQDLKSLPSTSEQQVAADLSRRPQFIDPFVQAASSKNARLANSAVVCLQRLVVIRGLPRSRLQDVLEAFSASTSLSLDIQLKILQALPALVQNYSDELTGGLIASALYVAAVLQNVKVPTVSAVAAATLQQLVVSVFDKVAAEDATTKQSQTPVVRELRLGDETTKVHEAAYDAYRVFQDLLLASEGKRTDFLGLPNFSQSVGLELVYSALNTYPNVFASHAELSQLLRDLLAPFLIRLLSDKQSFALSLRAMRLISPIIQRHARQMPDECEIILGLLTHLLDPESSPSWKRVMVMEVLKSIYATHGLILQLYSLYDAQEGRKAIVRDNISTFVRLSTEKPSLIGLGPQSTAPSQRTTDEKSTIDSAAVEATGGFAGTIASTNVIELDVPGLSMQWSTLKVQVIDLLDKTDIPPIPETYLYSLALECLNSLADNLAKIVLPLTLNQDTSGKRRPRQEILAREESASGNDETSQGSKISTRPKRSQSYRSSTVPVNPLSLEHSSSLPKVKAIAALIDNCWPALLATSSTFLYSALDNDYYRGLIRSVQKFTQVSGLLELHTARDAFLTTLGKAAVPPNLISSLSSNVPPSPGPKSPSFLRTKSLLSVNSTITSQSTDTVPAARRSIHESSTPTLSMRNMLCLRALINLAIALGPTLHQSFGIILGTLQQADLYLNFIRQSNINANLASLSQEVEAVAAATKRLLESTADYPNESFSHILASFCHSLDVDIADFTALQSLDPEQRSPSFSDFISRASSISAVNNESPLYLQDRSILLSKIGLLVSLNVARFAGYSPEASGWQRLTECLVQVASTSCFPKDLSLSAAEIVCRTAVALVQVSINESRHESEEIQKLALGSLRRLIISAIEGDGQPSASRIAVFCRGLESVRSILEVSGESLTVGWDVILESIDLAFVSDDQCKVNDIGSIDTSRRTNPILSMHSPEIGRVAFTITQLICADFLQSLKPESVINVIDMLNKFARQNVDLNISLTSITLFSEISNFLLRVNARSALEQISSPHLDRPPQKVYENLRKSDAESRAAQWIILLHQLSEVAGDERAEIKNAAFQMLLRIIIDQSLDPHAFQLAFTSVLLKCLRDNVDQQKRLKGAPRNSEQHALDSGTRSLLEGVATYIGQNVETFERTSQFSHTWQKCMKVMEDFLSIGSHAINQAVFSGLAIILRSLSDAHGGWRPAIGQIGSLWSSSLPKASSHIEARSNQQDAYLAYVDCGVGLVRLAANDITAAQVASISTNAVQCVLSSSPEKYGNDIVNMTKLQSKVLTLLRSLKIDSEGSSAALVNAASTLVTMPFEDMTINKRREEKSLTFVAISKEAMNLMTELIVARSTQAELYFSDAIATALESLSIPIRIKYDWPHPGKPPAPWKKATSTSLEVIPLIVSFITSSGSSIPADNLLNIWSAVMTIAAAIIKGDYSALQIPSDFDAVKAVEEDEQTDAALFLTLRSVILPHIGSSSLPGKIRGQISEALFLASIVHPLRSSEYSAAHNSSSLIKDVLAIRLPSLNDVEPSRREDMGYLCLAELISIVATQPSGFNWGPSSTFDSPYQPGEYGITGSEAKQNLAKAAAPWLMARFAFTIKAYIADQPFRGASRLPISMAEELTWVLDRMATLRCEPSALNDVYLAWEEVDETGHGTQEQETLQRALDRAKGKETMHIILLHSLLIKAVGVAGHPRHGDSEILRALMRVLDVDT